MSGHNVPPVASESDAAALRGASMMWTREERKKSRIPFCRFFACFSSFISSLVLS